MSGLRAQAFSLAFFAGSSPGGEEPGTAGSRDGFLARVASARALLEAPGVAADRPQKDLYGRAGPGEDRPWRGNPRVWPGAKEPKVVEAAMWADYSHEEETVDLEVLVGIEGILVVSRGYADGVHGGLSEGGPEGPANVGKPVGAGAGVSPCRPTRQAVG